MSSAVADSIAQFYEAYRAFVVVNVAIVARIFCKVANARLQYEAANPTLSRWRFSNCTWYRKCSLPPHNTGRPARVTQGPFRRTADEDDRRSSSDEFCEPFTVPTKVHAADTATVYVAKDGKVVNYLSFMVKNPPLPPPPRPRPHAHVSRVIPRKFSPVSSPDPGDGHAKRINQNCFIIARTFARFRGRRQCFYARFPRRDRSDCGRRSL